MNGAAPHTCDPIAATYLQHLQELAYEISAATDAIAANAMTRFKESVAKQEMLCASLASMANTVSAKGFAPRKNPRSGHRHHNQKEDSGGKRNASRTESAICRIAAAFRQVDRSSRTVVQEPHGTISGGSRAQVEASDLVLRDVIHGLIEYLAEHGRAIAGRRECALCR